MYRPQVIAFLFIFLFLGIDAIAQTTSLKILVTSEEANTALKNIPVIVEDVQTGKTDTAMTGGTGEASFTVTRGKRYSVYVYVIRINASTGQPAIEIPMSGDLQPLGVSLSMDQIASAQSAYKQNQALHNMLRSLDGKMPVMALESFYDSTSSDNPAVGAMFKIVNVATGQEAMITADEQGFVLIDGSQIGLEPGGNFYFRYVSKIEPEMPFVQGEGVDYWQYRPYKYTGGMNPRFSYPTLPIPVKRLATGGFTDGASVTNTPRLDKQLAFIASVMRRRNLAVEFQGHMQSSLELDIEQKKMNTKTWAESVGQLLLSKHGVATNLVTVNGFGDMFPALDDADPMAREVNRRVVVVVKGVKPIASPTPSPQPALPAQKGDAAPAPAKNVKKKK